jgi:hypothetical protein
MCGKRMRMVVIFKEKGWESLREIGTKKRKCLEMLEK